jgi:Zn-dependent membrane protease YugP
MFYIDPLYILLSLPALIISFGAQFLVRHYFSKYAKITNSAHITGAELAGKIAHEFNLPVELTISPNDLSDSYNPLRKELTLSESVANYPTIASAGIVAHEMGHALQHKERSFLMGVRTAIIPMVNIGTTIGYILFLLGIAFQIFNLTLVGIAFFSFSTFFTVITLPIELGASRNALLMIRELHILDEGEIEGVKKVLLAAALTYVAAVFQSLSSLLYYVIRAFGVKKKSQ